MATAAKPPPISKWHTHLRIIADLAKVEIGEHAEGAEDQAIFGGREVPGTERTRAFREVADKYRRWMALVIEALTAWSLNEPGTSWFAAHGGVPSGSEAQIVTGWARIIRDLLNDPAHRGLFQTYANRAQAQGIDAPIGPALLPILAREVRSRVKPRPAKPPKVKKSKAKKKVVPGGEEKTPPSSGSERDTSDEEAGARLQLPLDQYVAAETSYIMRDDPDQRIARLNSLAQYVSLRHNDLDPGHIAHLRSHINGLLAAVHAEAEQPAAVGSAPAMRLNEMVDAEANRIALSPPESQHNLIQSLIRRVHLRRAELPPNQIAEIMQGLTDMDNRALEAVEDRSRREREFEEVMRNAERHHRPEQHEEPQIGAVGVLAADNLAMRQADVVERAIHQAAMNSAPGHPPVGPPEEVGELLQKPPVPVNPDDNEAGLDDEWSPDPDSALIPARQHRLAPTLQPQSMGAPDTLSSGIGPTMTQLVQGVPDPMPAQPGSQPGAAFDPATRRRLGIGITAQSQLASRVIDQAERDPVRTRLPEQERKYPGLSRDERVSQILSGLQRPDSEYARALRAAAHAYTAGRGSGGSVDDVVERLRERIYNIARSAVGRLGDAGLREQKAVEDLVFEEVVAATNDGGDPFDAVFAESVAGIAGGLLMAPDIAAYLAGGVTGGASLWPLVLAAGLVSSVPYIRDAFNHATSEGGEGESKEGEVKEPPPRGPPIARPVYDQPGGGPNVPDDLMDIIRNRLMRLPRGTAPAAALAAALAAAPSLRDFIHGIVPDWDGIRELANAEAQEVLATLRNSVSTKIQQAIKQGRIQFRERPIELSQEDREKAAEATYGDIKPIQDVDNEGAVGDLRPSFRQLGTRAAEQSPEESLKERVQFANFNYVAQGYSAARNNPIHAFNREWDRQVRFTERRPYTHGLTNLEPVALVSTIRPTAGPCASNAVVEPMQVAMIRQAMLRRQSRAALYANTLLRDISNNTATVKPVADVNTIDTDVPLTNLRAADTDFAAYWNSNPVDNPSTGMVREEIVQRGDDIGPYEQYAGGFSKDLMPYRTGTNPTNFYTNAAWPQFQWNRATGAAQSAYAPSRQQLPNGLDLTATSEFLSPLGPTFGGRVPRRAMLQDADIRFPTRDVNVDLINQGW